MEIRPVDARDDGLLAAWHGAYERAQQHGREYAVPWQLAEIRARLLKPTSRRNFEPYAGVVDGEVVCSGALSLPLLDNLTSASLEVSTDPTRRGRGHGAEMLRHLESRAAEEGRSLLNAEVSYPYESTTSSDLEFAVQRRYAFGLGDVMRVLDLPVPDALLDRLAKAAAPYHAEHRLQSFVDRVPDEIVESFAALNVLLEVEAPLGELQREAMSPDVGALREEERLQAAQGRTSYNTIALDEAGEVVALTTIGTSVHEPDRAYQWGTLVRRDHRGHRLGSAVKVANIRLLQQRTRDQRTVFTWNAEVNAHMVGINEALGFHPVERLAELQKRL